MDSRQTSFELLAHFDRPKTIEMPDFESVNEALSSAPPSDVAGFFAQTPRASEVPVDPTTTKRGVRWVMQWAAALAMIAVAAGILTEFAYEVAAEHELAIAARAGAMEATLPRATYESVTATIERRLTSYPQLARQLHVSFAQNGSPVQRGFRQHEGDRLSITIWAPASAAVPDWLRTLMFWRTESRIEAHAERQMPGRKLASSAHRAEFGAGLLTPPQ